MTPFTSVDLSRLPFPETVQELDFETVLSDLKADLLARLPEIAEVINLETEPVVILLELFAAEVVRLRAEMNDNARMNTLAHAFGDSLDNFGAFVNVERLVLDPGDPEANPPVVATLQDDEEFRARIQLALEGVSVAGPKGAYIFHGLQASPEVKDVTAYSDVPGVVVVSLLSRTGDGSADDALRTLVYDYLVDKRPLCTEVQVVSADITPFTVEAELTFFPGVDQADALVRAETACRAYCDQHHLHGHDVPRAGLIRALMVPDVQNVDLTLPAADQETTDREVVFCSAITLTQGGTNV